MAPVFFAQRGMTMQAEGIRKGDRYDAVDDNGQATGGGWTATGDAEIKGDQVYVPVVYHEGGQPAHGGAIVRKIGTQVPITYGAGLAQPRFPKGPEYEAFATELREELAKWVAGEGEYAQAMACRVCEKAVAPGTSADSELHDSCAGLDRPERSWGEQA